MGSLLKTFKQMGSLLETELATGLQTASSYKTEKDMQNCTASNNAELKALNWQEVFQVKALNWHEVLQLFKSRLNILQLFKSRLNIFGTT